jgi:dihydrofolate reductase
MVRKVILFIASSLDGFIARKDGRIDWLPGSDVEGSKEVEDITEEHGYGELMDRIDTLIMGRKTYEQVLTFGDWPYSDKKSYVCTSKKLKEDSNVEYCSDAIKLVKDLKSKDGKDIWLVGGGGLNGSLMSAGLIDEIIVTVIPVLIGEGIGLFSDLKKDVKLKLVGSKGFKSGMVQMKYEVA